MPETIKKRRNFYLIGAILGVVFLFSYYFLAYIPQREDEMNARGIRVMARMDKNIAERSDHYDKSIELFECDYALALILEQRDTAAMVESLIWSDCFWKLEFFEDKFDLIDEQLNIMYASITYSDISDDKKYEAFRQAQKDWFVKSGYLKKAAQNVKLDPIVEVATEADAGKYIYSAQMKTTSFDYYTTGNEDNRINDYNFLCIKPDNFLKEIKRYQYFEDIILTKPGDSRVLDHSVRNIKFFNYQPSEVEVVKTDSDELDKIANSRAIYSIAKNDSGVFEIPSTDIVMHNIAGEEYYCFTSLVTIQNKQYYLTGLISEDKYNEEVRSVSIWVVMISIVFLIFLILALPVLKPFILSKKERLQGSDITWSAVGLVFGLASFALFVVGIDTFAVEEIDLIDKKLQAYTDTISKAYTKEKRASLQLLQHLVDQTQIQHEGDCPKLDWDVLGDNMRLLQIDKKGNSLYYSLYPSEIIKQDTATSDIADSLKNNGRMSCITDSAVLISKSLDLSHRKYYRVFRDNSLDNILKVDSTNQSYFVESIFSLSGGKYETVVALKGVDFPIMATVSQFKSINNVYLEPNYKFCIVDNEGVIHYHSDQSLINNENFLQETNQDERIKGFLKNNSNTALELNFSLNDYRAKIQPLEGSPWHIVTFYDIKKSRLTVTSSMALTFQIILAFLIYMLLLHKFFKFLHLRKVKKGQPSYAYMFLNPVLNSAKSYTWLSMINVATMLFLYLVYRESETDLLFNLSIFFATITGGILVNYLILSKSFQRKIKGQTVLPTSKSNWFEFALGALTVLWLSAIAINAGGHWHEQIYLLVPFSLLVLYALYKFNVFGLDPEDKSETDKQKIESFYWHTFSWVLLISIVPALLFFKPSYNQQNIKRTFDNLQEEFTYEMKNELEANPRKLNLFSAISKTDIDTITQNAKAKVFVESLTPYFSDDAARLTGQYATDELAIDVYGKYDEVLNEPFFEINVRPRNPFYNQPKLKASTIAVFNLPDFFHRQNWVYSIAFWLIILMALFSVFQVIKRLGQKFFYLEILKKINALEPNEGYTDLVDDKNKNKKSVV